MNKLPFMPFYTMDFLADTQHLTTEEKGIYLLLLCAMWHSPNATIPNDDRKLASIAGVTRQKWKGEKALMMEFLTPVLGGQGLTQKRLRSEQMRAGVLSSTRSRVAKDLWALKKKQNNGIGNTHAYASTDASTDARAYASVMTRARHIPDKDISSTSQSLPETSEPSTADAAGANPAGPPTIPVSDALLNTKIFKKAKGH